MAVLINSRHRCCYQEARSCKITGNWPFNGVAHPLFQLLAPLVLTSFIDVSRQMSTTNPVKLNVNAIWGAIYIGSTVNSMYATFSFAPQNPRTTLWRNIIVSTGRYAFSAIYSLLAPSKITRLWPIQCDTFRDLYFSADINNHVYRYWHYCWVSFGHDHENIAEVVAAFSTLFT